MAKLNGKIYAPEGKVIVRRKGKTTFRHHDGILSTQKDWLAEQGWKFTFAPATAAVCRPQNGRKAAPSGYAIYGRRGNLTQRIGRTCNEAYWKQGGWALSLRAE